MNATTTAELHLKLAKKALKLNIWTLKFNKDYDTAAIEFINASKCFITIKNYNEAICALIHAAQCYHKNKDRFGAGRIYERIALFYAYHIKNIQKATLYFHLAADSYILIGKSDTAIRNLLKAIDLYEQQQQCKEEEKIHNNETILNLYKRCIQIYSNDIEKDCFLVDILRNYINFLMRQFYILCTKYLTSSIIIINNNNNDRIQKELFHSLQHLMIIQSRLKQTLSYGRTVICKILLILFLYGNNTSYALKEIQSAIKLYPLYKKTTELIITMKLINAWYTKDYKLCKTIFLSSFILSLPNPFPIFTKLLLRKLNILVSSS